MIACATALLSSGAIIIAFQRKLLRDDLLTDISTLAEITADNCKASITFKDSKGTEKILRLLHTEPTIVYASAFTGSGKVFASYSRSNNINEYQPQRFKLRDHSFSKNLLTIFKPIYIDGQAIGGICIRSDLTPMYNKLWQNTYWTIISFL